MTPELRVLRLVLSVMRNYSHQNQVNDRNNYFSLYFSRCVNYFLSTRKNNPTILRVASGFSLRKHAYSNILKISPPKTASFQLKNLIFFIFLLKNIDCGYSLEPLIPKSMFLSRNKKMYTPVNPSFTIYKWGLRGQNYIGMFACCIDQSPFYCRSSGLETR